MDWTDIDSLERCNSTDALWAQALQIFAIMGFDFAIYLTVEGDRSHPHIHTNLPQIYEQLPSHQDPFLDHCCNSYEPQFTGTEFLSDHPYLGAEERAFIQEASVKTGFRAKHCHPGAAAGVRSVWRFQPWHRADPRQLHRACGGHDRQPAVSLPDHSPPHGGAAPEHPHPSSSRTGCGGRRI
ncbi:autoinducer binding domain-containing protein (plasmid) [Phaeobacter sp. BS52]|uniref:autoinducer binding domain-containing protein n=1 Tax=Phaeobacter sp. BS52 TaxID=2907241 RepID=UPI0038644C62